MFSPNQVGELIVGTGLATEANVTTFLASADPAELGVYDAKGGAVVANKPFYFVQKTAGNTAKGLDFEFSDKIDPAYIEKVTVKAYSPEVAKVVKLDGFAVAGVVAPQRTYEIEIRVENQLSPENFEHIVGYYVTGEVIGSDTATTVRDGLIASINKNLKRRGDSEFTVTADGTGILVTEKIQDNIPGKIEGRKFSFVVTGKVFNNVSNGLNANLGFLTATVTNPGFIGVGTGKFATNAEWFLKGFKYDPNRQWAFPVDFTERVPFYTSKTGTYNIVHIKYFSPRKSTIVERQYKVLTILVSGADNAKTNAILAKIRTAAPNADIDANLTVSGG